MWDANRTTLEKVKDPTFADKLKYTEEKLGGVFQYKFGVIYRKSGQAIDNDMLCNGTFDLLSLGARHGAPPHYNLAAISLTVVHGGRACKQGAHRVPRVPRRSHHAEGMESLPRRARRLETFYTTFNDDEFEIIFHVSTCLPYTNDEPQQLPRKRHIGNDVVVVVFQDEGSDPFTPEHISSHFNHAFFVIEPCTQGGVTRYRYARERERPRARADEGWSSDDSMRIVA